jgi:hypothetical protein
MNSYLGFDRGAVASSRLKKYKCVRTARRGTFVEDGEKGQLLYCNLIKPGARVSALYPYWFQQDITAASRRACRPQRSVGRALQGLF